MENDKFYTMDEAKQPVSAASEFMCHALCLACLDKMERILGDQTTFKTFLGVSLSVDFGSENDKPARFFVECKMGDSTKKYGYLFSDKDSREKMNNTISRVVLNIIAIGINDCFLGYGFRMDSVEIDKFPKRTAELSMEENKKYYDKLYLLL